MTKLQERKVIIEELQGDTLTPISIFQRLSGKKKFLLESSLKHEASGRYSFIGANPAYEIQGFEQKTIVLKDGQEEVISEKPLEVLKRLVPNVEDIPEFIPLVGGAVGFVGYDVIRHYEQIGDTPLDEFALPDVHFMMFEELIVFDHLQQKVFLVGVPLLETTEVENLKIRLLERKKEILTGTDQEQPPVKLSSFEASISKEEFIEKVKKAKEYIVEGDIFQVVLSQRMKAKIDGDPFSFYRKLRIQNPSPYMYYLDFQDYVVAGASPESLIKASNNKVVTNPIAGTRPRGKTVDEDEALAKELIGDEKELAEHQMLVDLGRNDIGRVSEFGTVQVDKYMEIEKYKHVMHLVSEVSGTLTNQYTPLDALIACLPAGTVSGAPKIRAMEIINELEEVKRGVYSGAIGYLSANGNMDFALAIRTMVMKGEDVYIQAGAGIVYDSVPEKEYEETLHKLKAFLEEDK
ncbi:anthranilate synthase component I [Robertmurraya yapensis]|uniref:Anthranilate synthase component 1 n=2 Tax=Bacillaceae TaxID=186817 RepID=A0A3S0ITC4_9BACI|nr:anthranilate synthase component I [Bacillus yapensis]RTR30989.1 anthranilate synthase component I [Bacillus yapensis]TKS95418.1 anthranilate synthase component I [Bacillus yapensis]